MSPLRPLRVVFFGTPEIACPTLERLIASRHEVVGVVSQPDRGRGRGRKASPSPVASVALREGIPLLRPEKIGEASAVEAVRAWRSDLGVVVAFGQFLPKTVRELPSKGYLINAHASLLPRHRGAGPIARAILDGDTETGISVMRIEREMDAGPVAAVARIPIGERENTAELSLRLASLAADLIVEVVDEIEAESVVWTPQDAAHATHAPKIEKADAILDLEQSAVALAHRIHALAPRPGASLLLIARDAKTELRLLRTQTAAFAPGERPRPGTVETGAPGAPLRIATGEGWLVPLEIQRAGGKALEVANFLRGFPLDDKARCERAALEPEST